MERDLITSTPHQARVDALVMILAGLRRGELIPFTWDDTDLDALKINVTRSVEGRSNNRLVVKSGTKTSQDRVVDITLDLTFELQKARTIARLKHVCPRADGEMHALMSWRRMWDSYIKALRKILGASQASIQGITAHYLRRTYAILLYLFGVDVSTVAKPLGHSNVKTMTAVYTHLGGLMPFKSVGKLDSHLSSALFRSPAQIYTPMPKLGVRRVTGLSPVSSTTKDASCKIGCIFSLMRFLSG